MKSDEKKCLNESFLPRSLGHFVKKIFLWNFVSNHQKNYLKWTKQIKINFGHMPTYLNSLMQPKALNFIFV
jgi:hypothetical protein